MKMSENQEYKKCSFDGRDYQPCEWMMKGVRGQNGDPIGISLTCNVIMSEFKEFTGGAVYRWEKGKNNLVYINYCPFCGENIEPRG